MREFFAIDLGTTNTVIASSYRNVNGLIETNVLTIPQIGKEGNPELVFKSLPSTLFFNPNGEITVGEYAKSMITQQPDRVLFNTKLYMGSNDEWEFDGNTYTAKKVATEILKQCYRAIEIRTRGDKNKKMPPPITITVPASFNTDAIKDTQMAAFAAGFDLDKIHILTEPTAAIIEYVNTQVNLADDYKEVDFNEKKRVLVFDLGGGTCDVCVVEVELKGKENISVKQIAVGRYTEFGGSHFDARCATELFNQICREHNIQKDNLTEKESDRMFNLLVKFSEEAKEHFSNGYVFYNGNVDAIQPYEKNLQLIGRDKFYPVKIDMDTYNKYTEDLYSRRRGVGKHARDKVRNANIEQVITKTIEECNIKLSTIDYVYLTGGMAQYPKVKEKVKEIINKPFINSEDMMTAVARGAAISMHYRVENNIDVGEKHIWKDEDLSSDEELNNNSYAVETKFKNKEIAGMLELNQVLAESIMIDIDNNLPYVIVPDSTPLPFKHVYKDVLLVTSPNSIRIDLYAGKDQYDPEMRTQHAYVKSLDQPVKVGTPIDIEVEIDSNKFLELKVIIKDGFSQPISLDVESDVNTRGEQNDV